MKKLVAIAAFAAVSACSQPAEEAPAPEATESAAAAETASMALDGKPDAGTFEFLNADGGVGTTMTFNADGTFTEVQGDKEMKGTWTKTEPATYCMTHEGEAEAACYTDTMDGEIWRTTNDADPTQTFTVRRVES